LVDGSGFTLASFDYDSQSFGNFVAIYNRGDIALRVLRDRSQVFVEFSDSGSPWRDKEVILEECGISRQRYPTIDSLWSGYEIATQSRDLREHLDRLIHASQQTRN